MSYDISLYVRSFLKRAIETGLGDWTAADPIPVAAAESLIALATEAGFEKVSPDPEFVQFLREQGEVPPAELILDTPTVLAQLSLHPGQLAFSIPYSGRAGTSIEVCTRLARTIAQTYDLAFYDPQVGIADY